MKGKMAELFTYPIFSLQMSETTEGQTWGEKERWWRKFKLTFPEKPVIVLEPDRSFDTMIRQGDVLLVEVTTLPANLKPVKRDNGKLVLAYGEATGHTHVLEAPEAEATLLTTKDNQRFLRLMTDGKLVHQEHTALHVPAGLYKQLPQEEWVDSMNQDEPAAPVRVID